LELAQERKHIARLAAAEAVEELSHRMDVERGTLLVVERAETLPVGPRAPEADVLTDDLHDVRAVANLGDLVLRNQSHVSPQPPAIQALVSVAFFDPERERRANLMGEARRVKPKSSRSIHRRAARKHGRERCLR